MKNSREARAFLLLLVVLVAAAIKTPRILEPSAIGSILLWIPLIAVMAVGQMLVIVSRGIDVSFGSTLGFSGIAVGLLFRAHPDMNVYLGAAIALGIGAVLGFVNGLLIAWVKIPPIIATLGTLSAYRGLTFILSHGDQIDSNNIPAALTKWSIDGPLHIGVMRIGPYLIGGVTIPWILVFTIFAAIAAHIFARHTVMGRNLYAVGSNAEAARMHGIKVGGILILAYTVCGALAGFSSILFASRYGVIDPGATGSGLVLTQVIAATVIGGCDVQGGTGTVLGVIIGSILLAVVNVALAVIGISADWQLLLYGAVIIFAIGLDAIVRRGAPAT